MTSCNFCYRAHRLLLRPSYKVFHEEMEIHVVNTCCFYLEVLKRDLCRSVFQNAQEV